MSELGRFTDLVVDDDMTLHNMWEKAGYKEAIAYLTGFDVGLTSVDDLMYTRYLDEQETLAFWQGWNDGNKERRNVPSLRNLPMTRNTTNSE